jgi:hypothetical protein
MQEIQVFLEDSADWQKGLSLYKKYFPDRIAFANRVERNPSQHHVDMMLRELAALVPVPKKQVTKVKPLPSDKPNPIVKQSDWVETDLSKPEYAELQKQMQYIWNKKAKLSNSLGDYAEHQNAERRLVVTEILNLKSEYNALFVRKKYYEQFGEMPSEAETPEAEEKKGLAELRLSLKDLHSRLSKKRKLLREATTQDKIKKFQEAIVQLEAEIKNINHKIKLFND